MRFVDVGAGETLSTDRCATDTLRSPSCRFWHVATHKTARVMIPRLVGALKGDIATFEEVEHDESATVQAAAIVAVSAVLAGLGGAVGNVITGGGASFFGIFIVGIVSTMLSWVALAAILNFVGVRFFNAESTFGEMLRVTGFAAVVTWLAIIPFLGLLSLLWYLYVLFKAIRAGLDLPTVPTLMVIVIGIIIRLVLRVIFTAIL